MEETDIDHLFSISKRSPDSISQITSAYQQYEVEEAEQFCRWEDETQVHPPVVEFNKKATFNGSRDFYISKWSDLSDGHLTFTMTRPTVGVCKSMRIQFDHNWNLWFFLGNVSLVLTYSLNKFLAECLDIPKTKIAYLHHQRAFMKPPLHIWSDAPIASQYPKIVCKFSLKPLNELPFIYLKVFEADTPPHNFWTLNWLLLDFVFIECDPEYDLTGFNLSFTAHNTSSEAVYIPNLTISPNNSMLVQRSKQSDIYAVALEFSETLDSPNQVKLYIRTLFEQINDGNWMNSCSFKVHSFRGAGIRLNGFDKTDFIRIMLFQVEPGSARILLPPRIILN